MTVQRRCPASVTNSAQSKPLRINQGFRVFATVLAPEKSRGICSWWSVRNSLASVAGPQFHPNRARLVHSWGAVRALATFF